MAVATPAEVVVGTIRPNDAVAAFERRNLLEPSFRWQDVWQDEHSRSLAVAGVQRLDVLQVFKDALDDRLKNGGTLADFSKAVRPALAAKGFWGDVEVTDKATGETRITRFDNSRLQLIYDVTVRQSFAAGQWARIERNKARMPFIIFKTMDDERVRPAHRAWHNLVLPVDHPFWLTHFGPCGWRCRCKQFAIDQAGIDRLLAAGQKLQFEAPIEQLVNYVNPRTGEAVAVPRGIDPGFGYNPGKDRDEEMYQQMLRKAWAAQPLAGAVAVAEATFARQEVLTATTARFGQWVDDVKAAMDDGQFHAQGTMQYVGAIKPSILRALSSHGLAPETAAIAVRDEDVIHALRDSKAAAGATLSVSVYRRLPELLERASAVLLDASKGPEAMLYVVDLIQPNGEVGKLVVQLDQFGKTKIDGKRTGILMNIVRTATVINPNALKDRKTYQLLWGRV